MLCGAGVAHPDGWAAEWCIEIVIGMAMVRVPTMVNEVTLHRVLAAVTRLR